MAKQKKAQHPPRQGQEYAHADAGPSYKPRSSHMSSNPNPSSSKTNKRKERQPEPTPGGIIDMGSWSNPKDGQPMMAGGQGPPGQFPLQSQKNMHQHFQSWPEPLENKQSEGFYLQETSKKPHFTQQYEAWYGKHMISPEIYGAQIFVGPPVVNPDEQEPQYDVDLHRDLYQLPSYGSSANDQNNPHDTQW